MTKRCRDCKATFEGRTAQRCRACLNLQHADRLTQRWAGVPKKYPWTPEKDQYVRERYDSRIKGRAQQIADRLAWPKWVITKRAAELGVSHPFKPDRRWTNAERAVLETWAGKKPVQYIKKQLPNRTLTAVVLKLKRLDLSRRVREGYTLRELEQCFGVDHHSIDRWIREGKLCGKRRGTARQGTGGRPLGIGAGPADAWQFTDGDVRRFVQAHPMAFRLDKVDQLWFLGLVFGAHLLQQEAS